MSTADTTTSVHTPGPWTISFDPDLTVTHILASNSNESLIAQVSRWGRSGAEAQKTAEANAHLIAAAPELLEALKEVLDTFSLGPLGAAAKYGPDVDLREIEESSICRACDAIAKAEGRTRG